MRSCMHNFICSRCECTGYLKCALENSCKWGPSALANSLNLNSHFLPFNYNFFFFSSKSKVIVVRNSFYTGYFRVYKNKGQEIQHFRLTFLLFFWIAIDPTATYSSFNSIERIHSIENDSLVSITFGSFASTSTSISVVIWFVTNNWRMKKV